jgi:hypothetical protein
MAGVVLVGFVFAFMLQFGQQLEDFSTFSKSFDALFRFRLRVEGLGFSSSSASPLMRSSGLGVRVTV